MTAPLPDRWEDEPWPLDDPIPAPGLRPTNWSDTHDQPPQVADLADEAWQYAVDHGISMERALVEMQDQAMQPTFHASGTLTINGVGLGASVYWVPGGLPEAPTVEEIQQGVDLTEFLATPDDP